MIGAERVSVSRAFAELRKAGAIGLVDCRVLVKDIQILERFAEGI